MRKRIVFSVAALIAVLATPGCQESPTTPPEFEPDSILSAADDSTLIDLFEEIVLPDDLDLDFADSTGVGGEGH